MALSLADCEFAPFDRPDLAARVALELELPPTAVTLDTAPPGALTIRIDAPCASREVTLVAGRAERELARRTADLGETAARARAWALALVVAELVRDAQRLPASAPAPARRRPVRQAADDESPFRPTPGRGAWSTLGAGLEASVYLQQLTLAPGVRAGASYDWLRVTLGGFAMAASTALGSITYGGAILTIGGRAALFEGAIGRLGAGAMLSGGLVYASGDPSDPAVEAQSAFAGLGGAGGAMWAEWPIGDHLVVDAELAAGYDAGPSFDAGGEVIAALRGIRVGIALVLAARR